jgi:hypothetical protein
MGHNMKFESIQSKWALAEITGQDPRLPFFNCNSHDMSYLSGVKASGKQHSLCQIAQLTASRALRMFLSRTKELILCNFWKPVKDW